MKILFKDHSFISNTTLQAEEITEAAPADVGCGPLIFEDLNVRKCLDEHYRFYLKRSLKGVLKNSAIWQDTAYADNDIVRFFFLLQ